MTLAVAALAALFAATVRGFAGFGSAMMLTPVLAALYGPTVGVTLSLLLEAGTGIPLLPRSIGLVNWRRIGFLFLGALIGIPFGTWLLLRLDPTVMRWTIATVILVAVVLLASGWRFTGAPSPAATALAGASSGFLNGMAGIGGPPIAFYYLAGGDSAPVIRASLTTYFVMIDLVAIGSLAVRGELARETLITGAILLPAVVVGGLLGERLFPLASERFYRRLALSLLVLVAVGSVVS